jgi:hypothetical protein
MAVILECLASPAVHHPAVYEKYMARNLKKVAQFVRGEMECGFRLPAAKRESSAAGAWLVNGLSRNPATEALRRKWDASRVEENGVRPSFMV